MMILSLLRNDDPMQKHTAATKPTLADPNMYAICSVITYPNVSGEQPGSLLNLKT